ncbi:hypothetical protein E2C01_023915 [Portunus trituberculatus]|uniref:Uncharacterized protein n=1 Tax=Portunus trituberculatus TaxID=210409 RepID=A0A5B7EB94_PORTR|nr:hypothetical protein [Portunus trituberculatus]
MWEIHARECDTAVSDDTVNGVVAPRYEDHHHPSHRQQRKAPVKKPPPARFKRKQLRNEVENTGPHQPVFVKKQDHDTKIYSDHDDDLGHVKAPLLSGDGIQRDIRQGLVVGHPLMSQGKGGGGEDPVGEQEQEC